MSKQKKEVQRSVRMTREIDEYIQEFIGDGFNEKFENLVIFCIKNEKKIKGEIASKKEEFYKLYEEVNNMRSLVDMTNISVQYAELLQKSIEECNQKLARF